MSRSQDIAREMDVARQYLAGSNGLDDLPSHTAGFSRLCDDVAPVVTGQGEYADEYTPEFSDEFWRGAMLGVAATVAIVVTIALIAALAGA